jgi:hypothetical protein
LLRCLLTVVFGDADRLEAFWVLVAGKARSECREMITAISIVPLGCFTLPLPRVNDGPDITPLIDLLAEVRLVMWAAGLPRIVP